MLSCYYVSSQEEGKVFEFFSLKKMKSKCACICMWGGQSKSEWMHTHKCFLQIKVNNWMSQFEQVIDMNKNTVETVTFKQTWEDTVLNCSGNEGLWYSHHPSDFKERNKKEKA